MGGAGKKKRDQAEELERELASPDPEMLKRLEVLKRYELIKMMRDMNLLQEKGAGNGERKK